MGKARNLRFQVDLTRFGSQTSNKLGYPGVDLPCKALHINMSLVTDKDPTTSARRSDSQGPKQSLRRGRTELRSSARKLNDTSDLVETLQIHDYLKLSDGNRASRGPCKEERRLRNRQVGVTKAVLSRV